MKLGMNLYLWTTNVTREFYYLFDKIKAAGYDGVEIPVGPGNDNLYVEIQRLVRDAGLACTTITNVGADANPISPDPAVRRKAVDQLRWAIEISNLLGSENMAGPFFAAYGVFSGLGPTQQELNWSAEVMQEVADYAQEANGLHLSIEFLNRFEIYLLNTTGQAAELVKKVNRPNFGILYDTHHAHHEENNISTAIKDAGLLINHVNFSENQRGALGQGLVDFVGTAKANPLEYAKMARHYLRQTLGW
jgi:D-psicose/D-tagatose/L-ribulose 3-epimerase